MDRQTADQSLAGLGAAHDRIAAAIFAIDSHPGLAFLRSGGLSGRTAERAQTLSPEVDLLWAHFNALSDMLERARAIRGQRRLDSEDWEALRLLLTEPVLALDRTGLPVEQASAAATAVVRIGELATGLEQRCGAMAGHLSEVDASWSAVAGRFAPLTGAFDAASAQAAELGATELVGALGQRLDRARSEDLRDPLAAAPGGQLRPAAQARLRELGAELDAVRQRLASLVALRDGYPQRLAGLRGLIDEVATAESGVRDAYARATEKIAQPALPPPPADAAILRTRLPDPHRPVRTGQWARMVDELAVLESSAREALARAAQLRSAADGLMDRRDELRGRLDAYRAKAARTGFGEDTGLSARYQRAHDLLFTAPCDLRQATQAVYAFQQALAELIAATKESTS